MGDRDRRFWCTVDAVWPLPGGEDELAHSEPGGALLVWKFQEDQFESCKGPWGGLLCIYIYVCVCVCVYVCVCMCVYGGGDLVSKSCPTLETAWTVTCQAPLSMEFSRQEYWTGFPFSSLGHLPDPGLEPMSPVSQVDSLLLSHQAFPYVYMCVCVYSIYTYACTCLYTYVCTCVCTHSCPLLCLRHQIFRDTSAMFVSPAKFICWSPNPSMWWYLGVEPLGGDWI